MKNKMIFMMLTLAVASKVMAQTTERYPLSKFALVSTTEASKGIELEENISKAIEAFGQPSKVEDYDFRWMKKWQNYMFLTENWIPITS